MTTDHDEIYEGRVARDEKNYPAMTHDELLAKINRYNDGIEAGLIWTTDVFIKALRAVVEIIAESDGQLLVSKALLKQAIEKELG